MKESLVCTLLTFVLLTTLLPVRQKRSTFIYDGQSNCVHQTVQGADILADKQLDVNRDGIQDEVVIYGNDDLYALVVVNQSTSSCEIILNSRLTSRQTLSGRKTVAVQGIELVDLTGDDQPELHIWLDLNTSDFRGRQAFH